MISLSSKYPYISYVFNSIIRVFNIRIIKSIVDDFVDKIKINPKESIKVYIS